MITPLDDILKKLEADRTTKQTNITPNTGGITSLDEIMSVHEAKVKALAAQRPVTPVKSVTDILSDKPYLPKTPKYRIPTAYPTIPEPEPTPEPVSLSQKIRDGLSNAWAGQQDKTQASIAAMQSGDISTDPMAQRAADLVTGLYAGEAIKGVAPLAKTTAQKVIDPVKKFVQENPAVAKLAQISAAAAGYNVGKGFTDPNFQSKDDDNTFGRLGRALRSGTGSTIENIGYSLGRSDEGISDFGQSIVDRGQKFKKGFDSRYTFEETGAEFDFKDTLNPLWWTERLGPSIPTTLALMIPALITRNPMALGFEKLGMSEIAASLATTGLQVPAMVVAEAAMEGGNTYQQVFDENVEKYGEKQAANKANKQATQTMMDNIKLLAGSNAAQYIIAFTPFKKLDKLGKGAQIAARGAAEVLPGAGEEMAQEAIAQRAMGKDTRGILEQMANPTPEMAEAGVIGGIFGAGFGAAGGAMQKTKKDSFVGPPVPPNFTPPASTPPPVPPAVIPPSSGNAQEEAGQVPGNITAPPVQATPAPAATDTPPVRTAPSVPAATGLIPQDIVQAMVNKGATKDDSWAAVQQYYGNTIDNVVSKEEHDGMFDIISSPQAETTPTPVVPEATVAPREPVIPEMVATPAEPTEPPALSAKEVQTLAENHFGIKLPDNSYEMYTGPKSASMIVAEAMAKAFGHKVVIVTALHGGEKQFNGFINRASGAIVLNSKSSNPMHVIMAHELTHSMETYGSNIYRALREDITNAVGLAGGVKEWYNKGFAEYNDNKTWDQLDESTKEVYFKEFVADTMQEASAAEGFFNQLLMKSVDAAEAFLNSISDLLNTLKGAQIRSSYSVQPYIEDWERAQEACQKAMAAYLDKAQKEGTYKPAVKLVDSTKETKVEKKPESVKVEKKEEPPKVEKKEESPKVEPKKEEPKKESKKDLDVGYIDENELANMTPKEQLKTLEKALDLLANPVSGELHNYPTGTPMWNKYNKRINDITEKITEIKKELGKKTKGKSKDSESEQEKQTTKDRQNELIDKYKKQRLQKFAKETEEAIDNDTQLSLMQRVLKEKNEDYGPQAVFVRSTDPVDPIKIKGVENAELTFPYLKPNNSAFWTSTFNGKDTISDWGVWTLSKMFYTNDELNKMGMHVVMPDPKSNILHLRGKDDVTKLIRTYGLTTTQAVERGMAPGEPKAYLYPYDRGYIKWIDWEAVSKHYDAVHFTKEMHEDPELSKIFYTDVESTAWLRPNPNFVDVSAIDATNYRVSHARKYYQQEAEKTVLYKDLEYMTAEEYKESLDKLRNMVNMVFKGRDKEELLGIIDREEHAEHEDTQFSATINNFHTMADKVIEEKFPDVIKAEPAVHQPAKIVPARKVKNKKTGEMVKVPASTVPEKTTPRKYLSQIITNLLKANNVKEEEIKWLDLGSIDHLDKITKTDLLKKIKRQQQLVKLEEYSTTNKPSVEWLDIPREVEWAVDTFKGEVHQWSADLMIDGVYKGIMFIDPPNNTTDEYTFRLFQGVGMVYTNSYNTLEEAKHAGETIVFPDTGDYVAYESIKSPGGENYKEIVISAPNMPDFKNDTHWKIPNVMLHIRTTDRTTVHGENVLHLEEIQSDIHQEKNPFDVYKKSKRYTKDVPDEWVIEQLKHERNSAIRSGNEFGASRFQGIIDRYYRGIPSDFYPYNNTGAWTTLGLKRLLAEAVNRGLDGITFTTGSLASQYESGGNMYPYYDEIIPITVNKYVKKWGVKLATNLIKIVDRRWEIVPYLEITDEMRSDIEKGQTQFSQNVNNDFDDMGYYIEDVDSAIDEVINSYQEEAESDIEDNELRNMTDAELRESMKEAQEEELWGEVAKIKQEWARRYKQYNKELKTIKNAGYYYDPLDDLKPYEFPPVKITHEEERELGRRAKEGDKDALTQLMAAHSGFVFNTARRYVMNKHNLTLDDLFMLGLEGLMVTITGKAKKDGHEFYTPDMETRLLTAAKMRIKQTIIRAINNASGDIRTPEQHNLFYGHVLRLKNQLEAELEETPPVDFIFDAIQHDERIWASESLSKVARLIEVAKGPASTGKMNLEEFMENQARLDSLNELVNDEEGAIEKQEMLAGTAYAEFMREVYLDEVKNLIDRGIDSLIPENPRNNERMDWADLVRAKYFPEEVFGEDAWELINTVTGTVNDEILAQIFVKEDGSASTKSAIGKKLRRIYDTLKKTAEIQQAWDLVNETGDVQLSMMIRNRDAMERGDAIFSETFNRDIIDSIVNVSRLERDLIATHMVDSNVILNTLNEGVPITDIVVNKVTNDIVPDGDVKPITFIFGKETVDNSDFTVYMMDPPGAKGLGQYMAEQKIQSILHKGNVSKANAIKGEVHIKDLDPRYIKKYDIKVGSVMPWSRLIVVDDSTSGKWRKTVPWGKVKAVIVPNTTSNAVIQALKDKGITTVYKYNDESGGYANAVTDAITNTRGAKFSATVKGRGLINTIEDSDSFTPEFISELMGHPTSQYTQEHFDEWTSAAMDDISSGIDEAIDKFFSDKTEGGHKTTLGLYLAKALHDRSIELANDGKPLESVRMNTQAINIARETSVNLTKAGQEVAAAKILKNLDPVAIITNMTLEHKKMFDKLNGSLREEITKEAKAIAEGMQQVHEEAIDEVLTDLAPAIDEAVLNSQGQRRTGRKHSADENDAILQKVEEHINTNENPNTPINKIVKIIHDIFGKWFNKDTQMSTPKFKVDSYVLDLVNRCLNMNQYPDIKREWDTQLRPRLKSQYGIDFATAQDFFQYAINRPEVLIHIDELASAVLEGQGKTIDDVINDKDIKDLAREVSKRVRPGLKPTVETRIRKLVEDNKKANAVKLARRLIKVASPKSEPHRTKMSEMLQMLSRLAKETIPNSPRVPTDPMQAVIAAIDNYKEYQAMWVAAKDEIMKIYNNPKAKTDISEQVKTLDDFFNRSIDNIIPDSKLRQIISKGLKEIDLTVMEVAKQHYTQQRLTVRSLTEKLMEQVSLRAEGIAEDDLDGMMGLSFEDADKIATMIQEKFDQVVFDKKQKMLSNLLKSAKGAKRQKLVDRIIMYSNIGAFSEEQYLQVVCEKLGLPAITPEIATKVMDLCDKLQNTVYDVVRPVADKNADRYYEIRKTKSNTWILMVNDPMPNQNLNAVLRVLRAMGDRVLDRMPMMKVGEYDTINEAMKAAPDSIQWRDFLERGGIDAQNELVMELHYVLASLRKTDIWEKIATAHTISMLLSVVTWARNVIGNESIYWTKAKLEKLISVPIDVARCRLFGGERTITFTRNASGKAYVKGMMIGVSAAARGYTPRGVEGQYELGFAPRFKRYGLDKIFEDGWFPTFTKTKQLFETGMSYLESAMRISLLGMDQAAFTRAYEDKMTEQAALFLINNGEKITRENLQRTLTNMEDLFEDVSIEYAKKLTFQNDSELTKGASKGKRWLNKMSTFGVTPDFGAGDVIIKFTKVPVNLSILAWEFSPFGIFNAISHAMAARNADQANKGKHITLATEHLADAMVGTLGFTAFGFWAGMMGFLTGKPDDDDKERLYNRSTGRGTYRLNATALFRYIGQKLSGKPTTVYWQDGDMVLQYSWLEPIGTTVAMGTEMGRKKAAGETPGYEEAIAGLGALFDKSVFENLMRLFEVPPGEKLSGETLLSNTVNNFATNFASSFVPAVSRQTRAWMDPYARVYWEGTVLDQAKAKVMDRIPTLSEKLKAQQDVFGQPVQRNVGVPPNTLSTAVMNYMSPMFISKYEIPSTRARQLIEDLFTRTKNTNALPSSLGKSVDMDKVTYKLTEDEYTELRRYRGEEIERLVQESFILNNPHSTDEEKIARLKEIYGEAGDLARKHIKKQLKVNRGIMD